MQADEVQDASAQRSARTLRLGPVGVVGLVFGLSVPLTIEIGMVVALIMAIALACMRRWLAVGVVLGATALGIAAWLIYAAVVSDDGGEGQVSCPDGRTLQVPADQLADQFANPTQERIDSICSIK